jgi:hypothetical protein
MASSTSREGLSPPAWWLSLHPLETNIAPSFSKRYRFAMSVSYA